MDVAREDRHEEDRYDEPDPHALTIEHHEREP
jgi:hypothetical protein